MKLIFKYKDLYYLYNKLMKLVKMDGKSAVKYSILSIFILSLLFVLTYPSIVKAPTEPFTISERTEYGISKNRVYVTIDENLGKDQIINISNIFKKHELTEQITYEDVRINQSHSVDDYGWVNVSLGKYKTRTEYVVAGNITTTTYVNYTDGSNNLLCHAVIA